MAYTKTVWKDRAVEKPRNYTKTDNADGTITLTPAPGIVTEAGTPIIAANLNKIEDTLEAHDLSLENKVSKTWGSVYTATLQNGWTGVLKYQKNDLGQVLLFTSYPGLTVGTKTAGTTVATLPAGFIPIDRAPIICGYNTNDVAIGLVIDSGGAIKVSSEGATTLTGSLRFSALYQANS